ncbi:MULTISPECIES: LuxR C-terminal-related transcriptional regulator [Segatella]|uniref:LuxR C-terminal-related transcriptional regulator n=1 Tax=Segatella TaxID=2974251 RepID=UPI0034607A0A
MPARTYLFPHDIIIPFQRIADRLEISKHTVDRHRQNIIAKLRVNNTTEACHKAKRLGLID